MDFGCEKQLAKLSKELSRQYQNAVFAMRYILENYQKNFPEYTDHSLLHVLDVTEQVNSLMENNVYRLYGKELYILLMGILVHDVGMGIPRGAYMEYACLNKKLPQKLPEEENYGEVVRKYHHRLSAAFVKSKWQVLDIPDEECAWLIGQVALGHRGEEIYCKDAYPGIYITREREKVALRYLAALVRLADEMDISKERIPKLLYQNKEIKGTVSQMEFAKHKGIDSVNYKDGMITVTFQPWCERDERLMKSLEELIHKLTKTAMECVSITQDNSPYKIIVKEVRGVRAYEEKSQKDDRKKESEGKFQQGE